MKTKVEERVQQWLESVVLGLNLCPFAKTPVQEKKVRFVVSQAKSEEVLLAELQDECEFLDATPAERVETTLLIVPSLLADFYDYNDFFDLADGLLEDREWVGVYQIASFHPDYCFSGTDPSAAENFTNRAPYPILHILREDSLESAIEHYPDVEAIPERNIETMNHLSSAQLKALFSFE